MRRLLHHICGTCSSYDTRVALRFPQHLHSALLALFNIAIVDMNHLMYRHHKTVPGKVFAYSWANILNIEARENCRFGIERLYTAFCKLTVSTQGVWGLCGCSYFHCSIGTPWPLLYDMLSRVVHSSVCCLSWFVVGPSSKQKCNFSKLHMSLNVEVVSVKLVVLSLLRQF